MLATITNHLTRDNLITHGPRIFFALMFTLSGISKLLIPAETMQANYGDGAAFMQALRDTGYLFPLLALSEVVAGLAILFNRYVPLALLILAPIVLNIVGYHLWVSRNLGGYVVTALVLGLQLYLAYQHRRAFAPLFQAIVSKE